MALRRKTLVTHSRRIRKATSRKFGTAKRARGGSVLSASLKGSIARGGTLSRKVLLTRKSKGMGRSRGSGFNSGQPRDSQGRWV